MQNKFSLFNSRTKKGFGRSAEKQAAYQLLGILSTLAVAIVGGLFTGT